MCSSCYSNAGREEKMQFVILTFHFVILSLLLKVKENLSAYILSVKVKEDLSASGNYKDDTACEKYGENRGISVTSSSTDSTHIYPAFSYSLKHSLFLFTNFHSTLSFVGYPSLANNLECDTPFHCSISKFNNGKLQS
jgi:hypothetical protein